MVIPTHPCGEWCRVVGLSAKGTDPVRFGSCQSMNWHEPFHRLARVTVLEGLFSRLGVMTAPAACPVSAAQSFRLSYAVRGGYGCSADNGARIAHTGYNGRADGRAAPHGRVR